MTNRFVILLHETNSGDHWDIMLENDSALTTWSIPPPGVLEGQFACQATRLPDHRKVYLDYEGEVSGGRGNVSRIDAGTYKTLSANQFLLHGTVFKGTLTIDKSDRIEFS
ncbi:hypothetical protein FACS1894189_1570 [Planctomycetales bacterium]|nr:hypothetical protein FACS1894189_1570 [Planctomycetales bacterium]